MKKVTYSDFDTVPLEEMDLEDLAAFVGRFCPTKPPYRLPFGIRGAVPGTTHWEHHEVRCLGEQLVLGPSMQLRTGEYIIAAERKSEYLTFFFQQKGSRLILVGTEKENLKVRTQTAEEFCTDNPEYTELLLEQN